MSRLSLRGNCYIIVLRKEMDNKQMLYNEIELKKLMKRDINLLSREEIIKIDILNFIRCIHLNEDDFYANRYDSKYFGDVEMIFRKEANSLIGHCRVVVKNENRVMDFLFTANGYELLSEIVKDKIILFLEVKAWNIKLRKSLMNGILWNYSRVHLKIK